jgi:hypothetical protein
MSTVTSMTMSMTATGDPACRNHDEQFTLRFLDPTHQWGVDFLAPRTYLSV